MSKSEMPAWVLRSRDARPVEGLSEIDITLDNSVVTLFIEAKLGSDISMRTTYDPQRNQIVRNIDCLLSSCGQKTPRFFMLVRDLGVGSLYHSMMTRYRDDPESLVAELPHHDKAKVAELATNLSVVRWADISARAAELNSEDSAEIRFAKLELRRRVGILAQGQIPASAPALAAL